MMEFSVGDRVEIYIPRADDPDHRYHGQVGEVIAVLEDDLGEISGNPERGRLYTVKFDDSELESADFRGDNLQPADR